MSTTEIESAIRGLPASEARALARWLEAYLAQARTDMSAPGAESIAKWRGRGRLPVGKNADDYLRLTRDGHGN